MIIEKLRHSDLSSYKELMDDCFGGSNELDYYKEHYSDRAQYEIIVAKEDNKIIGSITYYKIELFTFSFQPAIEIFNVAVLKEHREKKIAKNLFEYIIDIAKNNGYKSIFLTCLDNAFDAHNLYESIGFKKVSSRKYNLSLKE